jgi:hypothetical protein
MRRCREENEQISENETRRRQRIRGNYSQSSDDDDIFSAASAFVGAMGGAAGANPPDPSLNVEICNSIEAVNYLYKYVHKGHEKIMFNIVQVNGEGGLADYLDIGLCNRPVYLASPTVPHQACICYDDKHISRADI